MDRESKKRIRDTFWTEEIAQAEMHLCIEWFAEKPNIWLKRFALNRDYPASYMQKWAKKWPETCGRLFEMMKEIQEEKLFLLGLAKGVSATMPVFALKNICGWKDKQEIEQTVIHKDPKAAQDELFRRFDSLADSASETATGP